MTNAEKDLNSEELIDNPAEDESGDFEAESGEESEVQAGGDLSGDDGEGDGTDEGDDDEQGQEERQARRDRRQSQIDRLKEENKRLKEENRKARKEGSLSSSSTDMMAKAFLAATYDIKESEAQEEALRLADKFDTTVDELMEDFDYRDKILRMQKSIINQRKVAASSGNAAARKKGAEYAAEYFKKHNEFPKDASLEVRAKAADIVAGRQRQSWER